MEKGRYQYYAIIQNPEKSRFNRSFVFKNVREWTDQNGKYQAAQCLSVKPGSNGVYVVDLNDKENGKLKAGVLDRAVKGGVFPIIGPYDTIMDAVVAENKVRPLTVAQKLARGEADHAELEALRRGKAAPKLDK